MFEQLISRTSLFFRVFFTDTEHDLCLNIRPRAVVSKYPACTSWAGVRHISTHTKPRASSHKQHVRRLTNTTCVVSQTPQVKANSMGTISSLQLYHLILSFTVSQLRKREITIPVIVFVMMKKTQNSTPSSDLPMTCHVISSDLTSSISRTSLEHSWGVQWLATLFISVSPFLLHLQSRDSSLTLLWVWMMIVSWFALSESQILSPICG